MKSQHIRIGAFMPTGSQLLDISTVDVLGLMSRDHLRKLDTLIPQNVAAAPQVTISYITTPTQGQNILLTSNMTIKATHSYEDTEVAPGQLDIVVIPGADPNAQFEEGGLAWLRGHFNTTGVDILCVCTGIYLCGASGILNGKNVSGPRGLQRDLLKRFPSMTLVGEKYRWFQDGNLWTSGGITNGNDLMAAYLRESGRWDQLAGEIGTITGVEARGQVYEKSQHKFILGLVWIFTRAWFSRPIKPHGVQTKEL